MKKNKNLILTEWSKPGYVAAAAAALEALGGKADVAGVSMDALACPRAAWARWKFGGFREECGLNTIVLSQR